MVCTCGMTGESMKENGRIIRGRLLKFMPRSGKGKFTWPDGKIYDGDFKDDMQ